MQRRRKVQNEDDDKKQIKCDSSKSDKEDDSAEEFYWEREAEEEERKAKLFLQSKKLRVMLDKLDEIKGKDKTAKSLIFSQFTKYLDMAECILERKGYRYQRLDGTMSSAARTYAIKRFESYEETAVFIISLKAGGTGLNLVSANYVFLLDPWWNPAVEQQAINRVHRIGQKKKVYVYRMPVERTIEKKILELQQKKRLIMEAALSGEAGSRKLGEKDFLFLFSATDELITHDNSNQEFSRTIYGQAT
eukprot:TRINITY_DN4246_c0_g1_i1.p1 TRINITY_DN4246_c0_g1~~TRINITY_DN4246_c0_g1_i1.p1  ORF type:complete len:248 (-),score=55.96 TRINITY_DN4246_c0_g1_i1:426-1169(-)